MSIKGNVNPESFDDYFSLLLQRIQNTSNNLNSIQKAVGHPQEILDKCQIIIRENQKINESLRKAVENIPVQNKNVSHISQFDDLISNLYDRSLDLIKETEENNSKKQIIETLKIEEKEFINARDYHRNSANNIFCAILILSSIFVILVICFFWFSNIKETIDFLSKMKDKTYVELIVFSAYYIGRFAIAFIFGWLLSFLNKSYKGHIEQSITYQDRLAGIKAAEAILQRTNSKFHEEILKEMTNTYLKLNTNAFGKEPPVILRGYSLKEISNLASILKEVYAIKEGKTPSESKE